MVPKELFVEFSVEVVVEVVFVVEGVSVVVFWVTVVVELELLLLEEVSVPLVSSLEVLLEELSVLDAVDSDELELVEEEVVELDVVESLSLEEIVPTLPVIDTTGVEVVAASGVWTISDLVPPATRVTSPALEVIALLVLLEAVVVSWTSPISGTYYFCFCEQLIKKIVKMI